MTALSSFSLAERPRPAPPYSDQSPMAPPPPSVREGSPLPPFPRAEPSRRATGPLTPELRSPRPSPLPGQLPAFFEATLDDMLGAAFTGNPIETRLVDADAVTLPPFDQPLTLDVELALDRLTAQRDLGLAMGVPVSDVLRPLPSRLLTHPLAIRLDAVFACMERILAHCPDHLLSTSAQSDLEALMREADRLLGHDTATLNPSTAVPREKSWWRSTLDALARHVIALWPDSGTISVFQGNPA
ncbi:hypothetical protein [Pararhodospirillum oryzae]|uniref:Uncharacterized protein n=1 Tax=Pararhodospirillum oryzae TaxID=478448 RepID=A0A512H530_9PROT|nr:hypothetical protein [Pararhodospirillum oryzae]GEO80551.1 hypothetical protein ROR02_06820 [Pararhodospirillum oryzae]